MDSFDNVLRAAFSAHNEGRHDEAEATCRKLLLIAPKNGTACFLLGMVLHKTARHEEAVKWLRQASEFRPQSAAIFSGLGCAYSAMHDYPHAVECFARSIQLDPRNADTYYSIGNACHNMGETEKAIAHYRKAVELNPRDSESWNNLGKSLKDLNQIEEAIAAYDRALEVQPEFVLTRCNRAIALMTVGRLEEGLREYEWRWRKLTLRSYPQPVWKGEPISGKTLFLLAEQGFGDTIQFARYVQPARERGARVILECRAPLKSLFEYSGSADAVIAYGEPLPPFDYYVPLMSLPGIFHTRLDTIPAGMPYLKAPPCEDLPRAAANHLKVGLVWAGNPGHHDDAERSIQFEQLAPIVQTPGITFFSLQMPVPLHDETRVRSTANLVDLSGRLKDFLDTAAVIGQMDLVITVDTAVTHLAGALGKPTWTLIQYSPDWRWSLHRSDTPWYPTMRLFRQPQRGKWQQTITEVAEELLRLASTVSR